MSPDLNALLDLVRSATGADREIDRAIAKHFKLGWDYGADWPTIIDDDGKKTSEPTARPYTSSIDAALALTERVLPGWCHRSGVLMDGRYEATVQKPGSYAWEGAYGFNQPLAILAATLTALIARAQP